MPLTATPTVHIGPAIVFIHESERYGDCSVSVHYVGSDTYDEAVTVADYDDAVEVAETIAADLRTDGGYADVRVNG